MNLNDIFDLDDSSEWFNEFNASFDEFTDVTIVMSSEELENLLSICDAKEQNYGF